MTTLTIEQQANKLNAALRAVLRGSRVQFQMYRTPKLDGYNIHATVYGDSIIERGLPLITVADLSLDNVPHILNALAIETGNSIYCVVTKTANNNRVYYSMTVKHASGSRRISRELATALHECAVRSDEIEITNSRRTSEISFKEYSEYYQYETLGD